MMAKILILKNENECRCIALADLLYVFIDDYLSSFFYKENKRFTCTKSLLEVESILPGNFFRINRNCIFNLYAIETVQLRTRTVILSTSAEFIVSHRRIKKLQMTLMGNCNTLAD